MTERGRSGSTQTVWVSLALLVAAGLGVWAFYQVRRVDNPATGAPKASLETLELDLGGGVKMKLVLIPAGTFRMGSPISEWRRDQDEVLHEVELSRAYYLGTTEVTQEQYEAVMGGNPSAFRAPRYPVEQVSWNDAVEFCRKLSAASGRVVRLPTEAEWEYACRAGTIGPYGGNGMLDELGWYSANSGIVAHEVAGHGPNAWGLYDMHGNVWEWCSDWLDDYPTGRVTDPTGPASGTARIVRGGSRTSLPHLCRSANRNECEPDFTDSRLGFRVAVDRQ